MVFSVIFLRPNSKGSAQVEAALIIPLVVLIIVGMIELGTLLEKKVETSSLQHASEAAVITEGGTFPAETILRGKWYFK